MGKTLVIVESPNKIPKLQAALGKDYVFASSVGHIMDIENGSDAVDIENDFAVKYVVVPGKTRVVMDLKRAYKNASDLLIATDMDREGEMIGWNIAQALKVKNAKRIVFGSIDKKAVKAAAASPRGIDYNMVDAQKARRILDRIVGYDLSGVLRKAIVQKSTLSAGRVQSVVAKLIVEREEEIRSFFEGEDQSFFRAYGLFFPPKSETSFRATMYSKTGKDKDGKLKGTAAKIEDGIDAKSVLKQCKSSKFTVQNVSTRESIRKPSPPFKTSSMQQDANRKLSFTAKRTMMAAQHLYEGGYITYMRTDSTELADESLRVIKEYILKTYGKKYHVQRQYPNKKGNTQEAHEAIRPVKIETTSVPMKGNIGNDESRLYQLIWKRAVASQMAAAEFDVTTVQIVGSKLSDHYFMDSVDVLKFEGFLKVYGKEDVDSSKQATPLNVGDKLKVDKIVATEEYLKPPTRYDDGSLIQILSEDQLNIGRPATTPGIIEKIKDRKYVEIKDIEGFKRTCSVLTYDANEVKISEDTKNIKLGAEKKKFVPTYLGTTVTTFLDGNFKDIMDYKFTAEMEDELDDIVKGKKKWTKVLRKFYDKFAPLVSKQMKLKDTIMDKNMKILGVDPESGYEVISTIGPYGPMVKLVGPTKATSKTSSLPEGVALKDVTIKDALKLLQYPKDLGKYERKMVKLCKGRNGFYLKIGSDTVDLKGVNKPESLTIKKATPIIKERTKNYGKFESDTYVYKILDGPYGKYVQAKSKKSSSKKPINASIPHNADISALTLELVQKIVDDQFKRPRRKFKSFKKK